MLQDVPASANLSARVEWSAASSKVAAFLFVNHLGAIGALWVFTPARAIVALALYIAIGFGVTLGYHRLLAHRSFRTTVWFERLLVLLGTLSLQGGPVSWVAVHRQHHAQADTSGDPHNVGRGIWYAHVGWILSDSPKQHRLERQQRFARDVLRHYFYRVVDRHYYFTTLVLLTVLLWFGGPALVLWGICLRSVLGHHATWCVNSVCHRWGRRPYPNCAGTNNWLVAVVTLGEGWHNNHHAFPASAWHGLRPWELDASGVILAVLKRLGLVWGVRDDETPGTAMISREKFL